MRYSAFAILLLLSSCLADTQLPPAEAQEAPHAAERSLQGAPYWMGGGNGVGGGAQGGAGTGGAGGAGVGGNGQGGNAAASAYGGNFNIQQTPNGAPVFVGPVYGGVANGGAGMGGGGYGGSGGSGYGGSAQGGDGLGAGAVKVPPPNAPTMAQTNLPAGVSPAVPPPQQRPPPPGMLPPHGMPSGNPILDAHLAHGNAQFAAQQALAQASRWRGRNQAAGRPYLPRRLQGPPGVYPMPPSMLWGAQPVFLPPVYLPPPGWSPYGVQPGGYGGYGQQSYGMAGQQPVAAQQPNQAAVEVSTQPPAPTPEAPTVAPGSCGPTETWVEGRCLRCPEGYVVAGPTECKKKEPAA